MLQLTPIEDNGNLFESNGFAFIDANVLFKKINAGEITIDQLLAELVIDELLLETLTLECLSTEPLSQGLVVSLKVDNKVHDEVTAFCVLFNIAYQVLNDREIVLEGGGAEIRSVLESFVIQSSPLSSSWGILINSIIDNFSISGKAGTEDLLQIVFGKFVRGFSTFSIVENPDTGLSEYDNKFGSLDEGPSEFLDTILERPQSRLFAFENQIRNKTVISILDKGILPGKPNDPGVDRNVLGLGSSILSFKTQNEDTETDGETGGQTGGETGGEVTVDPVEPPSVNVDLQNRLYHVQQDMQRLDEIYASSKKIDESVAFNMKTFLEIHKDTFEQYPAETAEALSESLNAQIALETSNPKSPFFNKTAKQVKTEVLGTLFKGKGKAQFSSLMSDLSVGIQHSALLVDLNQFYLAYPDLLTLEEDQILQSNLKESGDLLRAGIRYAEALGAKLDVNLLTRIKKPASRSNSALLTPVNIAVAITTLITATVYYCTVIVPKGILKDTKDKLNLCARMIPTMVNTNTLTLPLSDKKAALLRLQEFVANQEAGLKAGNLDTTLSPILNKYSMILKGKDINSFEENEINLLIQRCISENGNLQAEVNKSILRIDSKLKELDSQSVINQIHEFLLGITTAAKSILYYSTLGLLGFGVVWGSIKLYKEFKNEN
jgi:hypothetical protein